MLSAAWSVHPHIHAGGRDHPYLSGGQTQAGRAAAPPCWRVAAMYILGRGQLMELDRTDLGAGGAQEETEGERHLLGGPFGAVCEEGRRACSPTHPSPAQKAGVSDPGRLGPSRRGQEALGSASGCQAARTGPPCSPMASAGVRVR